MASTVWRGQLTFGLVSIPVRLYPAARARKIQLNHVYRRKSEPDDEPQLQPERARGLKSEAEAAPGPAASSFLGPDARVHYTPTLSAAFAPAPASTPEIAKAFEFEKDRFLPLEKPDLDLLAVKTSAAMEISEFVKLSEIDPVLFETSYFVAPDPGGEKPYALLFEAMRASGYVGIASIAMHRREHVVILRPNGKGLLLHTMFYADEVRHEQEFTADPALVAPKELKMANLLVEALAAPFDATKYRDAYRGKLNALIAAKLNEQPAATPAPTAKPAIDIMKALQQSLGKLKKPPSEEKSRPRVKQAG